MFVCVNLKDFLGKVQSNPDSCSSCRSCYTDDVVVIVFFHLNTTVVYSSSSLVNNSCRPAATSSGAWRALSLSMERSVSVADSWRRTKQLRAS